MSDDEIRSRIEDLVAEEHRLWADEAAGGQAEEDRLRLAEIKVTLDQFWDLLRQRRALEEYGLDADSARVRDEGTVENYEQ